MSRLYSALGAMSLDLSASAPTVALAAITVVSLAVVAWRGRRYPYQARIGLRNAARRPLRTALIVGGLMLATMFISTALTLDDTIARAVKGVAVFSLGRVDEEVAGGSGPLGLYSATVGDDVATALKSDGRVAGVAPGLVLPNLLLVDQTTKQVRGDVLGVAIDQARAGPLARLSVASNGLPAAIGALGAKDVYLNRSSAKLLDARTGDTIFVYSSAWPNRRVELRVLAIVTGGPLGERPSALLSLADTQATLGVPGQINRVYVANGGDGLSGVGYSDEIAARLQKALAGRFHVAEVKQQGVAYALKAQDIFGRILTLYTLFALAIGLLLIFLIFALLASERRTELGIERAVGMHRADIVWMLLIEGAAYDLLAVGPGLLAGLGLGVTIILTVGPTVTQLGLPLQVDIEPQSVVLALCLGILFTLATVIFAVSAVTRLTVAAALRNLPEPPPPAPSLRWLVSNAARSLGRRHSSRERLASLGMLAWALVERGPLPFAAGIVLLRLIGPETDVVLRSVAVSLWLGGAVLWARAGALALASRRLHGRQGRDAARRQVVLAERVDRICALLAGVGLALYWSLPYDTLRRIGLGSEGGGVEVFFAAGVMMVLGAVLALGTNLDAALAPLQWLARRLERRRRVSYVALVYPAQQRLRTGISLTMFSLVCFTMIVMACIAASAADRFANFDAQAGGYDVVGQPLFRNVGGADSLATVLERAAPEARRDVVAVGSAIPVPLIMIQPGAKEARWGVYPAAAIGGAFLDGSGLRLVARSPAYASDGAVWRALRDDPGTVVIDTGALSPDDLSALGIDAPAPVSVEHFVAPPIASGLLGRSALESLSGRTAALDAQNRIPPEVRAIVSDPKRLRDYTLQLKGVTAGHGAVQETTIWVADPRGGDPVSLRVIGVVDNSTGESYGLLGSAQTLAPLTHSQDPFAGEYYFFKLRAGADQAADARAIGSALLDYGFQTTVIRDALRDENGPAVFASRILIGLVGFTLLIGMAALAVTGTRAVVERRQEIGMLRALGYRRRDVARLFATEAVLVGGLGAAIGLALGLVLCRNVFAVSFFEQDSSGIALVVPWPALVAICALAAATAFIASIVPAVQGSLIAPAEALRYE